MSLGFVPSESRFIGEAREATGFQTEQHHREFSELLVRDAIKFGMTKEGGGTSTLSPQT